MFDLILSVPRTFFTEIGMKRLLATLICFLVLFTSCSTSKPKPESAVESKATFLALKPALVEAIERGVRVVVYTTGDLDLPGGQVVVAYVSAETLSQARGLGLILVIDGEEVLVGEWLDATQARASWASSPLIVFIAEHHLRTDLYLPQILALLGDRALDVIHAEDRELFARALESHIEG